MRTGVITRTGRIFSVIIAACLAAAEGYPQTASGNSWYTGYSRGISMDIWNTGINYYSAAGGSGMVSVSNSFTTSMLKVTDDDRRWKDQNRCSLFLRYPLSRGFSLSAEGGSFLFSDRQTGYTNDIRTNYLSLGARCSSGAFIIPVTAGIKDDSRFGRRDTGLSYRAELTVPELQLGEYTQHLTLGHTADRLDKRRNSGITAEYTVHRLFQNNSGDTLTAGINHQRRDYYISAGGLIESRDTRTQYAENRLTYILSPGLSYRVRTAIGWRQLDITIIDGAERSLKRKRSDFTSTLGFHVMLNRDGFDSRLELVRTGEEQRYGFGDPGQSSPFSGSSLLVTPDNRAVDTQLAFFAGLHAGDRDSLTFSSSIRKYQYDTPSDYNFDDRDEIRIKCSIQEVHRASPALEYRFLLSTHLLHYVYIFSRRSADNNWTRILSFQPELRWRPSANLDVVQTAEVLANYVSYDFEALFPATKSFLYRKLTISDSLAWRISESCAVQCNYRLEMDENGKFLIDRWEEQRLIDRTSHTLTLQLKLSPLTGFSIAPGYGYYLRRGYTYTSQTVQEDTRTLSSRFRSHGPNLTISYTGKKLDFSLTASHIMTRTMASEDRLLRRIDCNCRLYI
ncbi:hypothetical protein JXO52_07145 [bacterium]|nr:hypothetical protein [bacterium]